jgi:transcriptional regulator with XRE-family HTH domain
MNFKEVGNRMREVRKALGYTQQEIVLNFNIGRADFSRIEKGNVFPNPVVLDTLIKKFDVSSDWLISNKGTMFANKKQLEDEQEGNAKIGDSDREIHELTDCMKKVPMVKHAVLSFYMEYIVKHNDTIQGILKKDETEGSQAA